MLEYFMYTNLLSSAFVSAHGAGESQGVGGDSVSLSGVLRHQGESGVEADKMQVILNARDM